MGDFRLFGALAPGENQDVQGLVKPLDALARIVEQHSAKLMRTRPFPGKWTPNEVIGHLVDSEWVYGYRMRLILCEDRPTILGMDHDLWVAGQRHNDREPKELVETFRAMRQFNLSVWGRLGPQELARVGHHNERGAESLGRLLRMIPGHDLSHIDQINRYLDAARKGK